MKWMKVAEACRHSGGLSKQVVYAAARKGQLRVARIGSGRNWVTTTEWVDQWLVSLAEQRNPLDERRS